VVSVFNLTAHYQLMQKLASEEIKIAIMNG
jgi:hypothetical protein